MGCLIKGAAPFRAAFLFLHHCKRGSTLIIISWQFGQYCGGCVFTLSNTVIVSLHFGQV